MPKIVKLERPPVWLHDMFFFIGLAFVILGIVSDVLNRPVGLEANSWFLIAVCTFIQMIPPTIMTYIATEIETIKEKTEK